MAGKNGKGDVESDVVDSLREFTRLLRRCDTVGELLDLYGRVPPGSPAHAAARAAVLEEAGGASARC